MPNENQYFVYIKKLNGKTRLIDRPCVYCFTAAVESKAFLSLKNYFLDNKK